MSDNRRVRGARFTFLVVTIIAVGGAVFAGCTTSDPVAPDAAGDPPLPVYEFGAKFEPPAGRVVHGMGQWEEYNVKYLALLPESVRPASRLVFIDLGDTPRGWQPDQIAAGVMSLDAAGLIPHLDLALRGLQPGKPDTLADPLYGIDDDIAAGSAYDGRIDDVIRIVRDYGKPVMIRIGGEFNGSWNGYHPFAFPKAFRKIVGTFRAAGADNAAFIWCYEPAAPGDFAATNAAGEYRWYPGADVIDWFSVDVFAKADVAPSGGRTDDSSYDRVIEFLDMAVAFGRPVIISESSPAHYDFTDPAQAQAAWHEWFLPLFDLIESRPEIKWFHYISYDWTQASNYAASGWKNNDLAASPYLGQQWIARLSTPRYLHANEVHLLNGSGM